MSPWKEWRVEIILGISLSIYIAVFFFLLPIQKLEQQEEINTAIAYTERIIEIQTEAHLEKGRYLTWEELAAIDPDIPEPDDYIMNTRGDVLINYQLVFGEDLATVGGRAENIDSTYWLRFCNAPDMNMCPIEYF